MKVMLGFAMMVAGVILGVWAGVFWALIGGIVDIVEAVKATNTDSWGIAVGVVKIMFSGFIGSIAALFLIAPGMAIAGSN